MVTASYDSWVASTFLGLPKSYSLVLLKLLPSASPNESSLHHLNLGSYLNFICFRLHRGGLLNTTFDFGSSGFGSITEDAACAVASGSGEGW